MHHARHANLTPDSSLPSPHTARAAPQAPTPWLSVSRPSKSSTLREAWPSQRSGAGSGRRQRGDEPARGAEWLATSPAPGAVGRV
eukprot:7644216-Pyramimonas_sp.AAC.1